MDLFKRKSLELAYDAHVVALYKDKLETPDGRIVEYDFIKHKSGGGAGILLVDDEEYTYLVKQYRNSIDKVSMEIPAGAYDFIGESGEICAVREGAEETGFKAGKVYHVTKSVSAIGTFDEATDIYIGTDLTKGETNYDSLEFIDVVKISMNDAIDAVYSGEIVDSKTIIAILAYFNLKTKGII